MAPAASGFNEKVVSSTEKSGMTTEEKLFEGRLRMKETVKSTLLRRKGELVRYVVLTTNSGIDLSRISKAAGPQLPTTVNSVVGLIWKWSRSSKGYGDIDLSCGLDEELPIGRRKGIRWWELCR